MSLSLVSPARSLRVLLEGIVDYAGLFPPAALTMDAAVREYAEQRSSDTAWALSRFVVPATRLVEFEQAARAWLPASGDAWHVSALVGPDHAGDVARLTEFNARQAMQTSRGGATVDAIETKAVTPAEIDAVLAMMPQGINVYVEVPIAADPRPLLERIAARNARAKVRTGGITPEAFPQPAQLARFLAVCAAMHLPFKATAGLHHPLRAAYRLTYEPNGPHGVMFGFLNVFLAAAALRKGTSEAEVIELLEESSPGAFQFDDQGVTWRSRLKLTTSELERTRAEGAIAFGSCSFREPVDDLRTINLL